MSALPSSGAPAQGGTVASPLLPVPGATAPDPTYYEAAVRGGRPIVIAPDGTWIEGWASLEHAQSYALEMGEWLHEPPEWIEAWRQRRPDPRVVRPFFNPGAVERDVSVERLLGLLDRRWKYET